MSRCFKRGTCASSAEPVERDRTRRRGCRAGVKHQPGRENLAHGTTCEYIRAQLGDIRPVRTSVQPSPIISPHVARKQYPEWFSYVLRHSDLWAFDTEGELLPVDTILRWATILPELWQLLYSVNVTAGHSTAAIPTTKGLLVLGPPFRATPTCSICRCGVCERREHVTATYRNARKHGVAGETTDVRES